MFAPSLAPRGRREVRVDLPGLFCFQDEWRLVRLRTQFRGFCLASLALTKRKMASLELPQDEARFAVPDAGNLVDLLTEKSFVVTSVGHRDPQVVVVLTGDEKGL